METKNFIPTDENGPFNLDPNSSPIVENNQNPQDRLTIAEANVKILDTLNLHPTKGTHFNLEKLHSMGIDFTGYSGRGDLYNIDQIENCHFIQIGNYRLYRTEFSKVLIIKII